LERGAQKAAVVITWTISILTQSGLIAVDSRHSRVTGARSALWKQEANRHVWQRLNAV
jgi:hypothetical protein